MSSAGRCGRVAGQRTAANDVALVAQPMLKSNRTRRSRLMVNDVGRVESPCESKL